MGKEGHTAEQIISKLSEPEVPHGKGMTLEETLRQLAISDATYSNGERSTAGFVLIRQGG